MIASKKSRTSHYRGEGNKGNRRNNKKECNSQDVGKKGKEEKKGKESTNQFNEHEFVFGITLDFVCWRNRRKLMRQMPKSISKKRKLLMAQ